jgi:hypothetical protein
LTEKLTTGIVYKKGLKIRHNETLIFNDKDWRQEGIKTGYNLDPIHLDYTTPVATMSINGHKPA